MKYDHHVEAVPRAWTDAHLLRFVATMAQQGWEVTASVQDKLIFRRQRLDWGDPQPHEEHGNGTGRA